MSALSASVSLMVDERQSRINDKGLVIAYRLAFRVLQIYSMLPEYL